MEQLKNRFKLGQETSFIEYETPTIPNKKDIDGYALPKENQKFTRWKFPKDRDFNLLSESEQLETVKYVLKKRKDGHWFYNNGEPTYITGVHWFYLTFWQLDVGYADYRASDRDKFYYWDYCVTDESSYGMINMENRRGGKTEQANCMIYEYISRTERADAGIQSKTNTDAKVVFLKLTRAWKRIPQWLNPIDEGDTQPKAALRFFEPSKRSTKGKDKSYGVALDSMIDFGTAKDEHYDGKKLHRYFRDEAGKTTEGDVYESWQIVKECLVQGQNIIGKAIISTTVEEMEKKGGKNFKKLWDSSDNSNRDANGRTITGLLPYFKPAYYCLEGFIDIYGNSVTQTPDKPVLGIDGKWITIGSKQYLDNKRASLSGSALASEKRKYPFEADEAFGVVYANIWEQDVIEIINRAEKEEKTNPSQIQYVKMYEFDGKVETNPSKKDDDVVKILEPIQSDCKYTLGIDSIGTDNETGSEDGSRLAVVLTKGFGGMEKMSFSAVLTYSERPDKLESAYEKIALIVKYVEQKGGLIQVVGELNAGGTNLLNYLINRGLKKFMMKRPKSLGTSFESTDGKYWIYRDEHVKSFQILLANRFIRRYGHNMKIMSLIHSLQMFGKQNADEADAFLVSLLGFTDFDKPVVKEKPKKPTILSKIENGKTIWYELETGNPIET